MKYEIKLPQFEGPFDLLLFFIERDELDIYDIPISKITAEFLDYIQKMSSLNIELASEFILVAATLMRIKSKMLLPLTDKDEGGNEIDPRQELVQKLLEYKRYKDVLEEFKDLEEKRSKHTKRGNISKEVQHIFESTTSTESELETVTLYKLLKVFNKVVSRYEDRRNEVPHSVLRYIYTVEQQKEYLVEMVQGEDTPFEKIIKSCTDKIHAIFTFLALLELLQERKLAVKIGSGANNFWISKA